MKIITPRGRMEERAKRDEAAVRREIIARVKFAEARGATRSQAIRWAADKMNLPVKDVLSTMSADK
jgi:hypothetical protein